MGPMFAAPALPLTPEERARRVDRAIDTLKEETIELIHDIATPASVRGRISYPVIRVQCQTVLNAIAELDRARNG